jgi:hypothetical protein
MGQLFCQHLADFGFGLSGESHQYLAKHGRNLG